MDTLESLCPKRKCIPDSATQKETLVPCIKRHVCIRPIIPNRPTARIPTGFRELLEKFVREVLRSQPENVVHFAAEYFSYLVSQDRTVSSPCEEEGTEKQKAPEENEAPENPRNSLATELMEDNDMFQTITDLSNAPFTTSAH